ncbi:hypothetical protein [Curtobacterium sp. 'Ferrero']|uniref:hypothetical protein n=1 Tax=Curtobacterium sp. 'Ferrero' TaxID=2033654 RepID=UPI00159696AB|nr:hypothetical protein [Curtobacterium sp. 'Ferrero']
MTRALPAQRTMTVTMPIPGRMGRAFRDGILLPRPGTEVVGPHFLEWVAGERGGEADGG